MGTPVAIGLAALAGLFVAVQAAGLGNLSRSVPPLVGAFWVQVFGVASAAVLVLLAPVGLTWPGAAVGWAVLAGACAVGIVASIGAAVTPLGLAATLAIVTAAQLLIGLGLDAAGITGRSVAMSPSRLLGAVLIVAGVVLVLGRADAAG
jgi:bacterial/archaeal transporter family-2 protein